MERYAVFRIGHPFHRLHATYGDRGRAAEDYRRLAAGADAVLVRVRGGAFTVVEARGADPAHVADDPAFADAVLGAFGAGLR